MGYPPSFTTQPTHKNTMKIIIAAILIILSDTASAGFLTGVIVGDMLSEDSKGASTPLLTSDNNDVLTCEKVKEENRCYIHPVRINGEFVIKMRPEQYVNHNGYKELIKQSAIIQNGKQYIVMGVR